MFLEVRNPDTIKLGASGLLAPGRDISSLACGPPHSAVHYMAAGFPQAGEGIQNGSLQLFMTRPWK